MKKEEPYKSNEKGEKDKTPKEKKYASTKGAIHGISEERIQKHKSASASCYSSGRSNQYTIEYDAKTGKNGDSLEMPTISYQNKRNTNDDDEGSKHSKQAKWAVVRAEHEDNKTNESGK
jgi:hypothetical protein